MCECVVDLFFIFRHMIDENNVDVIVMLAKLIENGQSKVAQYWYEIINKHENIKPNSLKFPI